MTLGERSKEMFGDMKPASIVKTMALIIHERYPDVRIDLFNDDRGVKQPEARDWHDVYIGALTHLVQHAQFGKPAMKQIEAVWKWVEDDRTLLGKSMSHIPESLDDALIERLVHLTFFGQINRLGNLIPYVPVDVSAASSQRINAKLADLKLA